MYGNSTFEERKNMYNGLSFFIFFAGLLCFAWYIASLVGHIFFVSQEYALNELKDERYF
jgi:hypothetical protein